LNQLFFLYTCRANPILADFVREVYWARYAGGIAMIANEVAQAFIRRAVDDDKTAGRWSESTVQRVASYLTGVSADYGLLGKLGRQGCQPGHGKSLFLTAVHPFSVEARLPGLYLKGLSTHTFQEALIAWVGPPALAVSATPVSRLKGAWVTPGHRHCPNLSIATMARQAQPICTVSIEMEPPSIPSTGKLTGSPSRRRAITYRRGK